MCCLNLSVDGAAHIQVDDTAHDAAVLAMGNFFWAKNPLINKSTTARVSFLNNRDAVTENGKMDIISLENQGPASAEFFHEMLLDLRTILPDWETTPTGKGVTDLCMYRVAAGSGTGDGGIVLRGGK